MFVLISYFYSILKAIFAGEMNLTPSLQITKFRKCNRPNMYQLTVSDGDNTTSNCYSAQHLYILFGVDLSHTTVIKLKGYKLIEGDDGGKNLILEDIEVSQNQTYKLIGKPFELVFDKASTSTSSTTSATSAQNPKPTPIDKVTKQQTTLIRGRIVQKPGVSKMHQDNIEKKVFDFKIEDGTGSIVATVFGDTLVEKHFTNIEVKT